MFSQATAIHTVETLWSCNCHEFNDTFEEKQLKQVFQNHSTLFQYLFILKLYNGCSMNALVFFFATLAEVQVAVFSVFSKSSTARISSHFSNRALLCLQPPVFCLSNEDSLTYSKQRMKKMSLNEPSSVVVLPGNSKHKMMSCRMASLGFVYGLLLQQATADTKPIERKIYGHSEITLRLCSLHDRATKS